MSKNWDLVPLGNLLTKSEEWIEIKATERYKQVTVKIWGKGVVQRNEVSGTEIAASKRLRVHSGQFILSHIDARHGAFGIIPDCLEGAVVTKDFPVFTANSNKMLPQFLNWMSKTANFIDNCKAASEGTTNRVRLKEDKFLSFKISLPPIEEQRRIVGKVEELAGKIEEARTFCEQTIKETEVIISSSLSHTFDYQTGDSLPNGWSWQLLGDLLSTTLKQRPNEFGRPSTNRKGMTTSPFGTLLQKSEIQSEGIPVLGISNVQVNQFIPGFSDYVTESKAAVLSTYSLEPEDIVIARSGTVGRSCVVPFGLKPNPIMSTNLIRLTLDRQIFSPELLCRLFNGSALVARHIDSECRGSTRSFFTKKAFSF